MRFLRGSALFLGATGLVAACSSGNSGGGGAVTPPASNAGHGTGEASSATTSANDFQAQFCDLFVGTCCAKFGMTYSQAHCLAISKGNADATYHAAAGAACLGALRTVSAAGAFCDGIGSENLPAAVKTACTNVFTTKATATRQPGESCESSSDCAASPPGEASCETVLVDGGAVRRCRITVRANEGDACDGNYVPALALLTSEALATKPTISVCWLADGRYCAANRTCAPRIAVGAACGKNTLCVSDAACKQGTCVALTPLGGACTPNKNAFFGDGCAEKTFCDDTSKTCAAAGADGTPCTFNRQCGSSAVCVKNKCAGNPVLSLRCGS